MSTDSVVTLQSPPTTTDGFNLLSEVGEGCSQPVDIAAANDESRRPLSRPGTVCQKLSVFPCKDWFRIKVPLEKLADVQQQTGNELLLRVLRHRRQGGQQAVPWVAHIYPVVVCVQSLRQLLASGELLLLVAFSASDDV